ncbi:MAG: M48 family metalloprotease [Promethearchaeota archaeon]
MEKSFRYLLFIIYLAGSITIFSLFILFVLRFSWIQLIGDWTFIIFILTIISYIFTIEESYQWVRNGKRSELSDIVAIAFIFLLILFLSKDALTSIMGAFSIYLWIGIFELKEYPILNKILTISLVTYNIIFVAGIFSYYLKNPRFIETSFAFSFWIILIMGFILFGRKYIIVWRFLSPEYLMLLVYVIAWLAVALINEYTPLTLISSNPLYTGNFTLIELFANIYFILIIVNWIIYFISGPILGKLLGIKKIENPELIKTIKEIKNKVGIKGKVKAGYGKYPILNAMAYGSILDKRIAIIAEDLNQIPGDELNGIVAHELAHTKGKHTLILTLLTSLDLIIRMLLGIPATYYDYTFGNPSIPLISFIILNISIYVLLFIFVRILEGRADLKAKRAGYGNDLAKALYNLESFYATGREIGFNTMLLSEEKITRDNQLLDYMNTASYLYNSMIKPSKISLLSNVLNSHPPSYFRISALLGDELKPAKEAILPFILLKKSKQKKFAKLFEQPRQQFKILANKKFKEHFKIDDISQLLDAFERKEIFKYDLGKDYIFTNKITEEIILGNLIDINFLNDLCATDQFIIKNLDTLKTEKLESSLYSRKLIDLNETYYLQKSTPLVLKDVILLDNKKENNSYVFINEKDEEIRKPILKTKLPNSVARVINLANMEVFLKEKGKLRIMKCVKVSKANTLAEYELTLTDDNETLRYKVNELIIRPRTVYLTTSKDLSHKESEGKILNWLEQQIILVYIYLKKPVNNFETGHIQGIETGIENNSKKSKKQESKKIISLRVKNIFGKEINIPYKTVESISFEYNSAMIQIKAATSISSRLGYKILKKYKPEKIIIT